MAAASSRQTTTPAADDRAACHARAPACRWLVSLLGLPIAWALPLGPAGGTTPGQGPDAAAAAAPETPALEDRAPGFVDGLVDGFVDLAEVAPAIAIDLRYAGAQNFVGRPVRGYLASRCLLARAAAEALAQVERDLAARGLGLMVYDCYRPQRAVDDFVAWAHDVADLSTRDRHYPAVAKSQLFARGYIAARSGHTRGSTVDLTLIPTAAIARAAGAEPDDCRLPRGDGPGDGSLDMGTTFDCFDERAHATSALPSPPARRHRRLLREAMARRGFAPYAKEWWHFRLVREPFPHRYFDFEIR